MKIETRIALAAMGLIAIAASASAPTLTDTAGRFIQCTNLLRSRGLLRAITQEDRAI